MRGSMKRILSVLLAGMAAVTLFCACSDDGDSSAGIGNDGWEGWNGWSGETDNSGSGSEYDPNHPVFNYDGQDLYVGAEQCYYFGGTTNGGIKFESYKENDQSEARPILTDCNGGEVVFVIHVSTEMDLNMRVCTALSTGVDHAIWASDKFTLKINDEDINLNAQEGVDEKWLWQQNGSWWINANYIVANFGTVHFKAGYNTVRFGIKSEEVQLDYFLFRE